MAALYAKSHASAARDAKHLQYFAGSGGWHRHVTHGAFVACMLSKYTLHDECNKSDDELSDVH